MAIVVRCDAIEDIRLVVRLQVEEVSFTISRVGRDWQMNARGPLIYGNGVCRRWIVVVVVVDDGRGVRNDGSCPCVSNDHAL